MKEFSCRLLNAKLSLFEMDGIDLESIFEAVPFNRSFVKNTRNWVDWGDVTKLYAAIEEKVGGRQNFLNHIRANYGRSKPFHFLRGIARLVYNPCNFYKQGNVAFLKRHILNIDVSWEQLPDGRIRNRLSVPERFAGCELFFAGFAVAGTVLPTLIGLPPSDIEAEIGDHYLDCVITCPPSRTLWVRLRVAFMCLFDQTRILDYFESQAYALTDKQENVEQLNNELRAMIEQAEYPITLLDEGVIRFSNQAFCTIFAQPNKAYHGQKLSSLIESPSADELCSWINESVDRKDVVQLRFRSGSDGRIVRALAHHRPGVLHQGRQMSMITLRDISREYELEKQLLIAEQTHRDAIAKELHDDLGQQLTAMTLMLGSIPEREDDTTGSYALKKLEDYLGQARQTTRSISRGLQPVTAETGGLSVALQHLVDPLIGVDANLEIITVLQNHIEPTPVAANQLYRIAQESFNNAIKHAAASRISISLTQEDDHAQLCIEDNGKGFNFHEMSAPGNGLGLGNMKRRAQAADIRMDLVSGAGQGCKVICKFKRVHEPAVCG